jgi:uncharacterized protein YbjT (DUF2867 family)
MRMLSECKVQHNRLFCWVLAQSAPRWINSSTVIVDNSVMNPVFVTGGTGYLGVPLIKVLLAKGYAVHALVRPQSVRRLPHGALPVIGDALNAASFASTIPAAATLVHLVGTPHPNPAKAAEFRRVDLASIRASVAAAKRAGVRHFVYLSVAQPAPVMQAYIAVRREGEALVQASGIPATILRPWYVLGPGHWWPCVALPFYKLLECIPVTREFALRLGMVTLEEMIAAMVTAVETLPDKVRVMNVTDINGE